MSTPTAEIPKPADADLQAVAALKSSAARVKSELAKVVVGQEKIGRAHV